MKHIGKLLPVLALSLVLVVAACTPKQIKTALDVVCDNLPTAELAFTLVAAKASESTKRDFQIGKAGLQGICDSRPVKNYKTALAAARGALQAILQAIANAEQGR